MFPQTEAITTLQVKMTALELRLQILEDGQFVVLLALALLLVGVTFFFAFAGRHLEKRIAALELKQPK